MSKADNILEKIAAINYQKEPKIKKKKKGMLSEGTKDILAGLTAGGASTFATYPVDTITTRRQVASATKGSGGLYSGVGLKLMKNVPGTAITLGTYGVTKRLLDKYFPEDKVNILAPSATVKVKK